MHNTKPRICPRMHTRSRGGAESDFWPKTTYTRRHTLDSRPQKTRKTPDAQWIKTLEDGRKQKFIYQEQTEDPPFITAQPAGNELVSPVDMNKARNPPRR